MPLSVRHKLSRLPKRFPVGTTFVVEGRAIAATAKNSEDLRIFSRFVLLPGGRRIDLGRIARTGDGLERAVAQRLQVAGQRLEVHGPPDVPSR